MADFLVADHVSLARLGPGARRIEALAAAYGAPVVDAGGEEGLAGQIQGRMTPEQARATVNPMRSPWWIVPFIACLGGEWWLRRRRGDR